jgi:para-nitrobenzyl esterase
MHMRLLVLLACCVQIAFSNAAVVNITGGKIQGNTFPSYVEFLGIPYAQPPIGAQRFLPTKPRSAWEGLWDATKIANACPRDATWFTINPKMNEDCLYLNLWAPSPIVPTRKLPVMVWIFGGGYMSGSGDSLQTRGNELVSTHKDVIVITFNYRLGILGWLGSEELRQHTLTTTGSNSTGNMGLLDMIEVLKWVKANVAKFGGDPSNVAVFGESAGAGATAALLTSPLSAGLFHKAIMESGGFQQWTAMTMQHAQGNFNALIKFLTTFVQKGKGKHSICPRSAGAIECLYKNAGALAGTRMVLIAEDRMTRYEKDSSLWDGYDQDQWGPIVDGVALKEHPFHALQNGNWHKVPVIIGTNADEGTEFLDGCPNDEDFQGNPTCNLTKKVFNHIYNTLSDPTKLNNKGAFPDDTFRKWLSANFGAQHVDGIQSVYNSSEHGYFYTNIWAADYIMGDYIMTCTSREAVRIISQQVPTFQYYFKRSPNSFPFHDPWWNKYYSSYGYYGYGDHIDDGFGACHGCEIPFVFYRVDNKTYGLNGTGEVDLGMSMSTYWTNFAHNSEPNDVSGRAQAKAPNVKWEVATGDATMTFDATDTAADNAMATPHPRSFFCKNFWDGYFKANGWFK